MKKSTRLVYSTETGRVREQQPAATRSSGDGIIRVRRETSGRKGKGVTTINGFDCSDAELKEIAKTLKQKVSSGGTVKDGVIEIQGDHRDVIKKTLEGMGYQVKLAGG